MMKLKIALLTLLLTPLTGLACAHAAGSATPVPDVIAPGDLPSLQALPSGPGAAIAPPGGYSAAPMPDADAAAPVAAPDEGTRLNPAIYGQKSGYVGDGYSQGSSDHARALKPATGVALNVPLD